MMTKYYEKQKQNQTKLESKLLLLMNENLVKWAIHIFRNTLPIILYSI